MMTGTNNLCRSIKKNCSLEKDCSFFIKPIFTENAFSAAVCILPCFCPFKRCCPLLMLFGISLNLLLHYRPEVVGDSEHTGVVRVVKLAVNIIAGENVGG